MGERWRDGAKRRRDGKEVLLRDRRVSVIGRTYQPRLAGEEECRAVDQATREVGLGCSRATVERLYDFGG